MKLNAYRRKKHFFFLLFFTIAFVRAQAQDFYGLVNTVMDHPILTRRSLADLQHTQLKLSSSYTYNDIYRESITDIAEQSLFGRIATLNVHAVDARQKFKYGVFSQIGEGRGNFTNLDADLLLNTDMGSKSRNIAFLLVLANNRLLWGGGMDQRRISFTAPVLIPNYPESEDAQMNRYFFDWLEPSFGNELAVQGEFVLTGFQTYTSLPLCSKLNLELNFRVSDNVLAPSVKYVNSSNISELQGERRLVFDTDYTNQLFLVSLESQHWHLKPTLLLQNTKAGMTVENPLPLDVIDDFRELGWVEFSRRGAAFAVETQTRGVDVEGGIGYSKWNAGADLTTPVLGRYWFFPIAHAAQLRITGISFSQRLAFHRVWNHGKISVDWNAEYQHAYFDLMVAGDAELEFNIRSVPIDSPLQIHLHTVSLAAPISYRFDSFELCYGFSQILPWVQRVDDSTLSFQRDDRLLDRKVRGGGQHTVTLSYGL